MPGLYDHIDMRFTWNGDFVFDAADLGTSEKDTLLSLTDQIGLVCASALDDWMIYPNKGAGLDDFIGEPNTKYTASQITDRLKMAIISSELVDEGDLSIRVVPIHIHRVLIVVSVSAMATDTNRLYQENLIKVSFVFDSVAQQVYFLDKTPQLTTGG